MTQRIEMTSGQRITESLSHREPDRVPFLIPVTVGGARTLGMSIREYFSKPENVVEGQIRKRERYRDDIVATIFYGALEMEAWGGEVLFFDDGPPNSGEPIITSANDIKHLEPPMVSESNRLQDVLAVTRSLKERFGDEVPVAGMVVSPFSLPVMQMGFEEYINLIYENREAFKRLMKINEEFAVKWAKAQLAAGADTLVYFDPLSSPTIIPRELFLETGYIAAANVMKRVGAQMCVHFASSRCLPIIEDIIKSGAGAIAVSAEEDLSVIKKRCKGRIAVMGNLNGIEMRHWDEATTEKRVKKAILSAAAGGGFVLTDNHGEIPYQVPESVLDAVSSAVHKWGKYPIDWVNGDNGKD